MKVSVSLPDEDVEYLDAYAQTQGLDSRSAALQKAVAAEAKIPVSAPEATPAPAATGAPEASPSPSATS